MSNAAAGVSSPAERFPKDLDGPEIVEGRPVRERQPGHSGRFDVDWQESRYVSPMPSPDDLDRYSRHVPDVGERLLAAGEREQAHRQAMELRVIALDEQSMPKFYRGQSRGQWLGFALALVWELIMLVAILEGFAIEGVVGGLGGMAAVIWSIRRDTNTGGPELPPTASGGTSNGDDEPPSPA